MRAFWAMHRNIEKIEADRDLRSLQIAIAAQSQEGFTKLAEDLREKVGQVVKANPAATAEMKRDEEGFNWLRTVSKGA